jgi:putative hydrolase of HD superfamily
MPIIDFLMKSGLLKSMNRHGWVIDGVKEPESVADHSFRTALMVMVLCPENLDRDKAVRMALVHDLPEAITGDLVLLEYAQQHERDLHPPGTFSGVTKKEKAGLEKKAMQEITAGLDSGEVAALWKEYEEGGTPEAVFVKSVDKLEMCIQAVEYELQKRYKVKDISHYFTVARQKIKEPSLLKLLDGIESRRPKN